MLLLLRWIEALLLGWRSLYVYHTGYKPTETFYDKLY